MAVAYAEVEAASGSQAKADGLARLLERCDPLTACYVVKVLTGDLRIGLREGLLEAALAEAFDRPIGAVKRAGMLTGDVGQTALLARSRPAGRARRSPSIHPLKFMLASPAEDAAEIIGRLGPTAWVEDKYDGIRAQLHRAGREVRLYSRDLHDITGQFPEVVAGARELAWSGILDGEILAVPGRPGPAVRGPPEAARPQGPLGRDPGRGAGRLRGLRPARPGRFGRGP